MKGKFYNFFVLISEYGFYGLLFFLPISNALVESLMGVILFGFVGRKIIKPDFKYLKLWPNIFLLCFVLFGALSLFNSGEHLAKSLNALFGKWGQYLGIYLILQDGSIYDRKVIRRGIGVFLFGALLAVFSGLSQYFFGLEFLRNRGIADLGGGIHAITSSFTHYNAFGGYLTVVLSLALALLLAYKSLDIRTVSLLIFSTLSMIAAILTFSRGAWLSTAVACIFMSLLARKNLKRLIPIFIVIIVMFLFPVFHERLFLSFKSGGDSDRFRYWLAALKMIRDYPFLGVGIGTFMANFSKYLPNSYISYAHNCYLQIWAETGIFSLISFMAFAVSFIYLGIKKFLLSRDFLLLGLLSGTVGFLTHSFFDVNLYSLRLAILFWVWVGLILGRISQKTEES